MRQAWRVADVRAAEKSLMATLPEGTLMQRAAAGLARRCALLLDDAGGVYGARVLLLVGSGDNGGDTLYAGAALARRGAQVRALLMAPERVHLAGLQALRAASPYEGRTFELAARIEDPKAPFYLRLRDLVVLGYFTSETGSTRELRYVAVPGRFDGDVDIKTWPYQNVI